MALRMTKSVRMLSVREECSGAIAIQYQALKRLVWLGTHYQGWLKGPADIIVDFYDDQGFLICTDRFLARRTATGDDVMNFGATAVLTITKPAAAKTYRLWLVK